MENPYNSDGPNAENFPESAHQELLERHKISKEHATELQNKIADAQEAKLGITLRRLMERTADNPELVNGLRDFLNSLDHQANFGDSEKPLTKGRMEDLAKFIEMATKALRWTVGQGNRPADLKIDFSRWEEGK